MERLESEHRMDDTLVWRMEDSLSILLRVLRPTLAPYHLPKDSLRDQLQGREMFPDRVLVQIREGSNQNRHRFWNHNQAGLFR